MYDIFLLSKDKARVAMYTKLAATLGVRLLTPPTAGLPPAAAPVLADLDTWAADKTRRAVLVANLCRRAARAPTAAFGGLLTDAQRTLLDRAGVVVARGPGRILLRTLACWATLQPPPAAAPAPKKS